MQSTVGVIVGFIYHILERMHIKVIKNTQLAQLVSKIISQI